MSNLEGDDFYWFHIDETNLSANEGDFLIVGGLAMTTAQMMRADHEIQSIRNKYGFGPSDKFKFASRSCPAQVSKDDFRKAKEEAISLLEPLGIRLMLYVVLHEIAANKPQAEFLSMAYNSLFAHFDLRFLNTHKSKGVVCVDRIHDSFIFDFLKSKHQNGLSMHDGRSVPLDRIMHYSVSTDGASNISSLVDISIGAFRYCVNLSKSPEKDSKSEMAIQMLGPLSKALWHKVENEKRVVAGYGYLAYPRNEVRVEAFRQKYHTLAEDLTKWTNE